MIVAAPDGKNIDFGNLAPDQVTAAMQKAYPPQGQFGAGDYLQQVAKGGTFGLVDEMGAGLGAAKMAVDRGSLNNFGQDYNVGLTGLRQDQASFEQAHPYQSIGLQLLGGAPAALGTGTAIANSLRGSNLATRMLASGAAGATSGAAYGFGEGEGQGRLQSAGQSAMVGGVLGAALPLAPPATNAVVKGTVNAGKNLAAGFGARNTEALQQTAASMKQASGNLYNQMRSAGAVLNDVKTNQLLTNIDQAISSKQFIPELNPKTLAIVDHLKEASASGNIGLNELDQYRRLLTRVGNSEDGVSAGTARRAIDDAVNSITPNDLAKGGPEAVNLLNKGRADYAKSARFEDISDILSKADGDPNRIKAGMQRFVRDPENLRGFNVAEVGALREAARTGIGENLLKAFGKFGFDFGNSGTGNTVLPALSMFSQAAGNPVGIPLAIGGTIARQGQKFLARGKAERALRVIEGRNTSIANDAGSAPPARTLLLEGPKPAYVVDQSGQARQQSLQELSDSILGRQEAVNMGLTPDIRRVSNIANTRNAFDSNYQSAQAQIDAIKQQQLDEMFSGSRPRLQEMVGQAMQSHKNIAQATGDIPTGDFGALLLEALRKQRMQ